MVDVWFYIFVYIRKSACQQEKQCVSYAHWVVIIWHSMRNALSLVRLLIMEEAVHGGGWLYENFLYLLLILFSVKLKLI